MTARPNPYQRWLLNQDPMMDIGNSYVAIMIILMRSRFDL